MTLVKPFNKTQIDKIKELKGVSFLCLQESNYQRELIVNNFLSYFDVKEVIKIRKDNVNLKFLDSLKVTIFEISLLSPIKIYIFEDIQDLKQDLQKKLLEILKIIPEYVIVINLANSIAKTNAIYKFHQKDDLIIDSTVKNDDILSWIKEELKNINLTKRPSNLETLILEAAENNIDNIKEIIDYLSIYIKDNEITLKEFEKLFPSKANVSDFKILDPIYSADFLEYLRLLKLILKNKNEFLIMSIFQKTFTKILEFKFYDKTKLPLSEIASKTNMQEWLVKKNLQTSRLYSERELNNKLRYILKAEAKLKDKNLGPFCVFEELFFKLAPINLLKRKY